jgi:hypothetical protein
MVSFSRSKIRKMVVKCMQSIRLELYNSSIINSVDQQAIDALQKYIKCVAYDYLSRNYDDYTFNKRLSVEMANNYQLLVDQTTLCCQIFYVIMAWNHEFEYHDADKLVSNIGVNTTAENIESELINLLHIPECISVKCKLLKHELIPAEVVGDICCIMNEYIRQHSDELEVTKELVVRDELVATKELVDVMTVD